MPDLPTFAVTAAQAQKLVEVFGDEAGYLAWLREALRHEVRKRKVQEVAAQQQIDLAAAGEAAANAIVDP